MKKDAPQKTGIFTSSTGQDIPVNVLRVEEAPPTDPDGETTVAVTIELQSQHLHPDDRAVELIGFLRNDCICFPGDPDEGGIVRTLKLDD